MSQGNRLGMMQPQVIVLREGTDTSQGTGQLLSNIGACLSIVACVASTLGPRGMDKLIVSERGDATISNDGATILKLLDIVHPAAKTLVDIARAQDAEVGDGTTSVVLLAGEMLKEARPFIEEGVSPHVLIKGFRKAAQLVSVCRASVPLVLTSRAGYRQGPRHGRDYRQVGPCVSQHAACAARDAWLTLSAAPSEICCRSAPARA
jgi:hypothetical protein